MAFEPLVGGPPALTPRLPAGFLVYLNKTPKDLGLDAPPATGPLASHKEIATGGWVASDPKTTATEMSDFVAYVESKAGKPHCVVPPGGGVYSQEHGNRRTELICDDATLPAGTRVTVVLMNRPTSAEPGWYSQHGHVRLWLASPPDGKRMETEFVMGSHDGSIQAGRATPAKSTPRCPSPPPSRLSPRFSRSSGRRVPAAVVQRPPREGERPQAVQVRRREGVAPLSLPARQPE
jgi:hypothetical protein